MRKSFKYNALLILSIIAVLAIFDSLNSSNTAEELRAEKDMLSEEVINLEKEQKVTDELHKENKQLAEEVDYLYKKIEALEQPIIYQDFVDSINAVEEFLTIVIDRGNCPCVFIIRRQYEWSHNSAVDPYEFYSKDGKIYLTYETEEYYDYTFVLVKHTNNGQESWRIEDIKYKEKN